MPTSHVFVGLPVLEGLENRLFLDAAPTLVTDLNDTYVLSANGPLTIGVDATDADGDAVTISAVSTDPGLVAEVRQGQPYALLHFTEADGTPMGDILIQLFGDSYQAAIDQFITLATRHVAADGTTSEPTVDDPAFWTDVPVHRIYPDFVVQTGDAVNGDGTGDSPLTGVPDYADPDLSYAAGGVVGFANAGAGTSNCQFFITAGPTPHLNGGYIILGQVISGWDTYDALMASELVDGTDDVPVNPPVMTSVDILQPGEHTEQDGTISFYPADGFVGTAQVTVTLTDSEGLTTDRVIDVTVAGIAPVDDIQAIPGQDIAFTPTIVSDGAGGPTAVTALTSLGSALTASVDPGTYEVTFSIPADYTGTFQVLLSAEFDDLARAEVIFSVTSDAFPADFADSYLLGTHDPLTVQVDAQTAGGGEVTMEVETATTNLQAEVVDNQVTFTALNGWAGTTQAAFTLTDANGLDQTKIVDVTVAGIVQPAAVYVAPGQSTSFTPTIVSDGAGGPTDFTATTAQAGASVSVDPDTHQVTVTSPAGFLGTFDVELTATYDALAPSTRTVQVNSSVFGAALADEYVLSTDGPLTVGVDGAGSGAVTIEVVSSENNLIAQVRQNETYARLNFTDAGGTAVGSILIQLFDSAAPAAVERFITLATKHVADDGTISDPTVDDPAFWTDVPVHRISPGFVIQTGDAANGDGTGDSPLGDLVDNYAINLSFAGGGVLAYANAGSNTSNCQFFITADGTPNLDGGYMIFGQIVSGWDTYASLMATPLNTGTETPTNAPILTGVDILEPGQYVSQDGTITFYAVNGWAGQAEVTVALTDSQGATQTKVINVTVAGIVAPDDIQTTPGQTATFTPTIIPNGEAAPTSVTAAADLTGATATYDAGTGTVTVTVPTTFSGVFTVTLTANFDGLAPSTRQVAVFVQGIYDPTAEARIAMGLDGSADFILVAGNLLFVAAGNRGLEIYDMEGTFLGGYDTQGYARDVVVSGTTAFVADTWGGLLSLDVSDPAHITGNDARDVGSPVVALAISGDTLFVTAYDLGLLTYDISDPAQLVACDALKQDARRTIQYAMDVVVQPYGAYTFAIVSDSDGGAWVINATDPCALSFVSGIGTGGSPWGMQLKGNLLYIADQDSGLLVVNMANPARPYLLNQLAVGGSPWQVSLQSGNGGTTAILSTTNGLVFVDVTDYRYLYVDHVYSLNGQAAGNVLIAGNAMMAAIGQYGVATFDAPNLLGRVTVFGARSFVVDGVVHSVSVGGGAIARVYPTDANFTALQRLEVTAIPTWMETRYGSFYWATGSVMVVNRGGQWAIGNIYVDGMLNVFNGSTVNLAGAFTSTGPVLNLYLNNLVSGSNTITTNTAGLPFWQYSKMNLFLGQVADTTLNTNGVPINMLRAVEWLDTGTANSITAPSIRMLQTLGRVAAGGNPALAGDFQSNMTVPEIYYGLIRGSASGAWTATTGVTFLNVMGNFRASLTTPQVRTMIVGGNMDAATLSLTGAVAQGRYNLYSLSVTGWITGSTITSSGNLYYIRAGGMANSKVFAGVATTTLPTQWSDFSTAARLVVLALTGMRVDGDWVDSFVNSNIAAWTITSLSLSLPNLDNDGTLFGVSGDSIARLSIREANTVRGWSALTDWSQTIRLGDLIVRLV
ncbi:MAG: putative peptidyl-prolyl cis-trans isomerase [Planctomycetes bacterium ADurb.Bin126]|mgnify:CR=1 FL=1|nr:MAG: putative peptidyl-prolyl cis-trans isomerase [Planctomycetes bacterium ADurb.Bin126]HQL71884.1 peptidylprolyl isomerase [Phycisphaerae bacterium]